MKFVLVKKKVEIKMQDIISPVESQLSELEIPSIDEENEDMEYTKMSDAAKSYSYSDDENRPKNALDLFFDDEDEEDEEDDEIVVKQALKLLKQIIRKAVK